MIKKETVQANRHYPEIKISVHMSLCVTSVLVVLALSIKDCLAIDAFSKFQATIYRSNCRMVN